MNEHTFTQSPITMDVSMWLAGSCRQNITHNLWHCLKRTFGLIGEFVCSRVVKRWDNTPTLAASFWIISHSSFIIISTQNNILSWESVVRQTRQYNDSSKSRLVTVFFSRISEPWTDRNISLVTPFPSGPEATLESSIEVLNHCNPALGATSM